MAWVVFLRAVNVGGTNRCQPAQIAKQLARFGVVNIGAVGTFVVHEEVSESTLRNAFVVQLAKAFGVKCEIMICPARDVIKLSAKDPFARQPSGPNITRVRKRISQTAPPAASAAIHPAFRRRLAGKDHCDPRQIRPGSVS